MPWKKNSRGVSEWVGDPIDDDDDFEEIEIPPPDYYEPSYLLRFRADLRCGAKISDREVMAMRIAYASGGFKCSDLAWIYGLKPGHAHGVIGGNIRKNLPMPDPTRVPQVARFRSRKGRGNKLSDDDVRVIRKMYANRELSGQQLAELYSVSPACISFVVHYNRKPYV